MQEIKREILLDRAVSLLADGTVDRVLGWKNGEFDYDVTPAVFRTQQDLEDFVWNGFCGANFSKYLVGETRKGDGKVLAFLKPCDTYSFNQLINEHRVDREKAYIIGVGCRGKIDMNKIIALTAKRSTPSAFRATECWISARSKRRRTAYVRQRMREVR